MSINVNFTNNLSWAINQTLNSIDLKNFYGHAVTNIKKAAEFLVHNNVTQTTAIVGFNLLLLNLADKITAVTLQYFTLDDCEKNWCKAGTIGIKGLTVLASLSLLNHAMKLHLSRLYVTATVVTAITLQVLWQKVLKQAIEDYRETGHLNLFRSEKELDDSEVNKQEEANRSDANLTLKSGIDGEKELPIFDDDELSESSEPEVLQLAKKSNESSKESKKKKLLEDSTFLSNRAGLIGKFAPKTEIPV
jgi:hypothetical protein